MQHGRRLARKTFAAVAAVLLCVVAWLLWSRESTPPGSSIEIVTRDAPANARSAGASVSRDRPESSPSADATEREAATTDRRPARGRVVYTTTRDGVPFCRVTVRDGAGSEDVPTDRVGAFATRRAFAADASVLVWDDQPFRHARELDRSATANAILGVPDAVPVSQWMTLESLGPPDALEVPVALGPTYFVRTTLPPGKKLAEVSAALAPLEVVDRFVLRGQAANSDLRPVPDAPDLLWCRFPKELDLRGRDAALTVLGATGSWFGSARVQKVEGVQREPVEIALAVPARVHGVVRRSNGTPRSNLFVTLVHGANVGVERMIHRTEEDGRYSFEDVQPGPVRLEVVTEDVEPWRVVLDLSPGADVARDIRLADRRLGGSVAGTITTESGAEFVECTVALRSRDDTTVWRTANIQWRDVDGKRVARWSFENVPVVPCEVELQAFTPCAVSPRSFAVSAPAEHLAFHVHDRLPAETVTFRVVDRGGQAQAGYTVLLRGDQGWRLWVDQKERGSVAVVVPVGQTFSWSVVGDAISRRTGKAVVVAGKPLEVHVAVEPGFSQVLLCLDAQNFHPLQGVEVWADSELAGVTDARGEVAIDRPQRPKRLEPDSRAWRRILDGPRLDGLWQRTPAELALPSAACEVWRLRRTL